jgi:hypothetical protein
VNNSLTCWPNHVRRLSTDNTDRDSKQEENPTNKTNDQNSQSSNESVHNAGKGADSNSKDVDKSGFTPTNS